MSIQSSEKRTKTERLTQFLNDASNRLEQAIDNLQDTELNWRPSPSSNSIGNLLKHIAGAETFWIHHVISGRETTRIRSTEFEVKEFHIADLREELTVVKNTTTKLLTKLADKDIDKTRTYWSQLANRQKKTTVHWAILHIIEHTAQHTGQIFYIRKMYADLKPQ
ncbi:MAG: DinB family protein [Candidatus Hodarchaeota archaeon]